MRVDEMAAARANMRQRTLDPGATVLTLSADEIAAKHARQARLNYCTSACGTCCRRVYLTPPDGARLACALIMLDVEMTPGERALAEGCQVPALYAEVMDRDPGTLKHSDALKAIPFHVPPEAILWHELAEAETAVASGTYSAAQATLLAENGAWNPVWGNPPAQPKKPAQSTAPITVTAPPAPVPPPPPDKEPADSK